MALPENHHLIISINYYSDINLENNRIFHPEIRNSSLREQKQQTISVYLEKSCRNQHPKYKIGLKRFYVLIFKIFVL